MTKPWKYDLDIARYTREIEQDPNNFRAFKERGNVYFRKKEFDHAIVDYNRAIELNPDFFLAYNNRGNVYMQTGQYALAIADYDKAIALKPDNGMPYNNRGFAFLLMGNLDAAEADIQASLRLNPDNIYALNSMAEIYAARDNAEEACRWLHRAIEKGYNNWNYIRTSKTYEHIRHTGFFVIPLLVESGDASGRFDRILVVDCTEDTQIARVCARPGRDAPVARGILAAQATRAQRLAVADDVVFNEAPTAEISLRVDRLHQRYVHLAEASTRTGV